MRFASTGPLLSLSSKPLRSNNVKVKRLDLRILPAGALLISLAACAHRSAPPSAAAPVAPPHGVPESDPPESSAIVPSPGDTAGSEPIDPERAVGSSAPEQRTTSDSAVAVVLRPFPHVEVDLSAREVRFDGIACLDVGWLEQVVCAPNSREHESLIVSLAQPSHIHAALLAAEFEPGAPGRWTYENDQVAVIPPTGEEIEVEVIYENRAGDVVRESIRAWIRDHRGEHELPATPWVFGGSRMRQASASLGGGEVYEADYTGSIIGLVTFGDEVIGWREVLSDHEAVHPPEWEVNTGHVPTPGTPVQVILKRASRRGGSG
jgi:hypothetical protein